MSGSTATGTTGFTGGVMKAASLASSLYTIYSIVQKAYGMIPDGPQKRLVQEYVLNYAASFLGFSSWVSFIIWQGIMAAAPEGMKESASFQNNTYSAAETVGGFVSQGRKINEALNMVFGAPVVQAAKELGKQQATQFATEKAIPALGKFVVDQSSYLYEAIRQTNLNELAQTAAASATQMGQQIEPIIDGLDNAAFQYTGMGIGMPALVLTIGYYNKDQILQVAQAVVAGTQEALRLPSSQEIYDKLPQADTKRLSSGEIVQVGNEYSGVDQLDYFRDGLFDLKQSADAYASEKMESMYGYMSPFVEKLEQLPSWRTKAFPVNDEKLMSLQGLTKEQLVEKYGPNLVERLEGIQKAIDRYIDAHGSYAKANKEQQKLTDFLKDNPLMPRENKLKIQDAINLIQRNVEARPAIPTENIAADVIRALTVGRGLGENKKKKIEGRGSSAHITEGVPRKKDEYKQFGKYLINCGMLDEGVVSVRSKGGWRIKNSKNKCVGGSVKGVLQALLESRAPSNDDLLALSDEEKEYINNLTKSAGVGSWQEVPTEAKTKSEKLIHEFEKMRGIIAAGNDNPELIKDFKRMLVQLIQSKQIDRNQAHDILMELTVLGY